MGTFYGSKTRVNFIELLSREFCLANISAKQYKTDYIVPAKLQSLHVQFLAGNQENLLNKYFW